VSDTVRVGSRWCGQRKKRKKIYRREREKDLIWTLYYLRSKAKNIE
jgi:hypothetical protein